MLLAELDRLVDVLDGVQDELEGLLDLAHAFENVHNLGYEVALLELLLRLRQDDVLAVLEELEELVAVVLGVEDDLHGVVVARDVGILVEQAVQILLSQTKHCLAMGLGDGQRKGHVTYVVEEAFVLGQLLDDAFDRKLVDIVH